MTVQSSVPAHIPVLCQHPLSPTSDLRDPISHGPSRARSRPPRPLSGTIPSATAPLGHDPTRHGPSRAHGTLNKYLLSP